MNDFIDILHKLERYHAIFAKFWLVGTVVKTDTIPTAAIAFDRSGNGVEFLINNDFWQKLNTREKAFVIAHECLHVYFEHGARGRSLDPQIANIAMDLIVNHSLIDRFGFDRDRDIRNWQNYIWFDTVFGDEHENIERGMPMEYYYNIIKEKVEENKSNISQMLGEKGPSTVDDHSVMSGVPQDIVEDIVSDLTPEELEDFMKKAEATDEKDSAQNQDDQKRRAAAGTMPGYMELIIKLSKVKKKRTWEQCVKNILGKFMGTEQDITIEQWAKQNRRTTELEFIDDSMILPAEIDEITRIRDRIEVWCFQDVSGSCRHLVSKFAKAIASIPEDKFKLKTFAFDTQIYEIDMKKPKFKGFGGTSFKIIENFIQKQTDNNPEKYPDVVFVVTDGMGDTVEPKFPDRWHWFIEGYYGTSQTVFVPEKSSHYDIDKFASKEEIDDIMS